MCPCIQELYTIKTLRMEMIVWSSSLSISKPDRFIVRLQGTLCHHFPDREEPMTSYPYTQVHTITALVHSFTSFLYWQIAIL